MFRRNKKVEVISELTTAVDKMMQEFEERITPKPLVITDLSKGFNPIEGLEPGDKLRIKGGQYNTYNIIVEDTVLTVHRVGAFPNTTCGSALFENDFTVLFLHNEEITEYPFDSRRFELVK